MQPHNINSFIKSNFKIFHYFFNRKFSIYNLISQDLFALYVGKTITKKTKLLYPKINTLYRTP